MTKAPAELQPDDEADKVATPDATKPKPGDVDYDWTQHYGDIPDLFKHTLPDGQVVALKPFNAIYSKTWLYKLRNVKSNDVVAILSIDRASCREVRAILADIDDAGGDIDPITDLWDAWSGSGTSHSGDPKDGLTAGN